MAKTTFQTGDTLLSAFMNCIFGNGSNGGHRHDGADADGHCDKVNLSLSAEVKGTLPVANMAPHVHSGANGNPAKVNLESEVQASLPWENINNELHNIPVRITTAYLSEAVYDDLFYTTRGRITHLYIPQMIGSGNHSNGLKIEPYGMAGNFNTILPVAGTALQCIGKNNDFLRNMLFYIESNAISFYLQNTDLTYSGDFFTGTGLKGVCVTSVSYFNTVAW